MSIAPTYPSACWTIPRRARSLQPLHASLGLVLYCGILFLWGLGERELTSSHEARAAQNAQTILDQGHWLVPRLFDRHLELQKPPLYYWLVALIGWLQGGTVDAWAVRLPAALSALCCVLFLNFLGVRLGKPRAGLLAALILATCVHFTWLARVGRIDMPLTFTITLALGAFHLGNVETGSRTRWHALGYTSLALGVLLKGPIAIVLPALVCGAVFVSPVAYARGSSRQRTTLWWGVPWLLTLAAPWFVWANHRTDNQLWEVFFWYHNVERGLGGAESLAAHPWWFYGPRAFVDLLPWSVSVPAAFYVLVRYEQTRKDPHAWTGLLWFAAMALFLSCMRFKRADYLLPAYPGLAIFLGVSADHVLSPAFTRSRTWLTIFLASLVVYALAWTIHSTWSAADPDKSYRVMAQEIRGQTQGPVIFFRAESHVLAFHVGQPLDTILEWENLAIWASRPFPVYFVMPEACARQWRDYLPAGALEEVLRTTDYATGKRDRPLVVLRSRGKLPANP